MRHLLYFILCRRSCVTPALKQNAWLMVVLTGRGRGFGALSRIRFYVEEADCKYIVNASRL